MTVLARLAKLIRSKNAGPFELTFDIMFEDAATYERVKRSGPPMPVLSLSKGTPIHADEKNKNRTARSAKRTQ